MPGEGAERAGAACRASPTRPENRRERLRQFGPDVEIETLPDLDVIILRGRDRDVQELKRLIEEIERLSAETQPVIEIYPLKHVGGEALALITSQVDTELTGGRQGRVTITPLVKAERPVADRLGRGGQGGQGADRQARPAGLAGDASSASSACARLGRRTVHTTIQEFFPGPHRAGAEGPRRPPTRGPIP